MMKDSVGRLIARREVLQGTALAALATTTRADGDADTALQFTKTASRPSDLRITDLRVAVVAKAPMTCPIIRIDTNQGISGFGEVRDGASKTYALMLKSRLLGENPCNIDKIFRKIKQFGFHARQGGGVSGVEVALWDLAGKAYGVPDLPDAGRQVPRQNPLLRGYRQLARSQGLRGAPEGTAGPGIHHPEDGPRDRPAPGNPRHGHPTRGADERGDEHHTAHVHRHRHHAEGDRRDGRLRGPGARGHRHGSAAGGGPLRPHRGQCLHQAGQGSGEVQPGLARRHDPVAEHGAVEEDHRRGRRADAAPARTSTSRRTSSSSPRATPST